MVAWLHAFVTSAQYDSDDYNDHKALRGECLWTRRESSNSNGTAGSGNYFGVT
jgi:hypothetical protein